MIILGPLLISIAISMTFAAALLSYFNNEEMKKQDKLKEKIKALLKPDKKSLWMVVATIVVGILVFSLEYYFYKKFMMSALRWQVTSMMMVPIGYIDLKKMIIPNVLLLIGITFAIPVIAIQIFLSPDAALSLITSSITAAVASAGIFFIGGVIIRNGVGAGDVKMNFALGLMVGVIGMFNVLLYSTLISALTGIVLIVVKRKKTKDILPLAPFTLVGVLLAVILGV